MVSLLKEKRTRKRRQPVYTTLPMLLDKICTVMELSVDDIISSSRAPRLVMARAVFSYIARERGLSLIDIGDVINRDHSSITYYLKNLDSYLDKERPFFREEVYNEMEYIKQRLRVMLITR